MNSQGIPLLTEIVPKYEGIYPPETIEVVYRCLRDRIDILTPIVEANERAPLIAIAEREGYEKGERAQAIEKKFQNNKATKQALNDCKVAWERLIDGTAHLCTVCGGIISKDRKQAVPVADKCRECQEKKGLRVS